MPKSSYIPFNDDAFAAQLQAFKNAIPGYAATLDLTTTETKPQADDADYFSYVLACQQIMQNGARQWTGWNDLERRGGDLPPTAEPVAPTFPTAVTAVAPGIEARFRALVKQIKAQASYNESIGEALGIEGAQQAGPDYATLQPVSARPSMAPCRHRLELEWVRQFPRPDRNPGRPRPGLHASGLRHHARPRRYPTVPRRTGEMDLPGHLPRWRRPRGAVE
jgi:hypothetical protein